MLEKIGKNIIDKCLLISVDTGEFDVAQSLSELERLAATAGAIVIGTAVQKRPSPSNATYIGKGKLAEIGNFCEANDCNLLIFDAELTPSQQRNIEMGSRVRTIDRTTLILDIFAMNAKTSEGKLQVELAQLKYLLPRLSGRGTEMSRLGGGIGTRGPGETKLETDKRYIRKRIDTLEQDLKEMEKRRALLRKKREKAEIPQISIVGYTNAGKSTLLNTLTDAGVLTEDKLFATLDPTSRMLTLPGGRKTILTDTVGFVSRLPHELVEAFKSTLEEVALASLILIVVDASDPEWDTQLEVTRQTIKSLGAENTPTLTVFNKCDRVPRKNFLISDKNTVKISALNKTGISRMLEKIEELLFGSRQLHTFFLPYSEGALTSELKQYGNVISEQFLDDGILIEAETDSILYSKLRSFVWEEKGSDG